MDEEKDKEITEDKVDNEEPMPDVEASEQPDPEEDTSEPEAFVDSPASETAAPVSSTVDMPQSEKHSKKKWLYLILFLLVTGAAAYYLLIYSKEEATPQSTENNSSQTETEASKAVYYQEDNLLIKYDVEAKTSSTLLTLPEDATIAKVSNDGATAIYSTITPIDDDPLENGTLKLFKATSAGNEEVFSSTSVTNKDDAYVVVSHDLSKVAFFAHPATSEDSDAGFKIISAPLDGSNKEDVLDEDAIGDDSGILFPRGWTSDNNSVILQSAECYRCDGFFTANVWKATIGMEDLAQIFSQPEGTNSGWVVLSPDGSYLAISAQQSQGLGDDWGYEESKAAPFDVYAIDLSGKDALKVFSDQNEAEYNQSIYGWTNDSSNIILGVYDLKKPTDSGESQPSSFLRFDAIPVDGGQASPIPVVLSTLDSGDETLTSAFGFESTLFFTTATYLEETTNTLYSLPIGGGESPINTISTGKSLINLIGASSAETTGE